MSLPWLREDYKRPESRSRSRSSSTSRGPKNDDKLKRNKSRSRSPRSSSRDQSQRGRDTVKGRGSEKSSKRRHSSSSSASSQESNTSTTRLVASSRPKYVNSRIFVANINSKDITKGEIVTHFEKYGNVVDCLIHPKNYIFVQFLKEDHARLAVEGENGSTLNGFRMDVKMANENRKPGGQHSRRDHPGGRYEPGGRPPRDRGDRDRDPYGPDPFMHDRRPPPHFPPGGDYGMRDPRDPYFPPPDPYRRGGYPHEPWMPPEDPYRRDPYTDPYRDPYVARPLPPPPPPAAPVGPVECEVFIVSPQLRTYGEIIERKVKDQSIITALSVIPEGRTAPQMIEELSVKGGLFAIFLNAQNEVHRSLTLNILHGTPQEHRNMPSEDAISLVGRSFEKYVEELRAKANADSSTAPSTSGTSGGRVFLPPTSEVTYLLNLLADNRALTVTELDTVIKYLHDRRDKLIDADKRPIVKDDKDAKPERAPSESSSKASESTNKKDKDDVQSTHEELTKKILSIFQGVDPSIASKLTQATAGSVASVPAPQPAPPPPTSEAQESSSSNSGGGANLINFDNPNVQKALNNLIQSGPDLLKSFSSGSDMISSSSSSGLMSNSSISTAPPMSSRGMMGNGGPQGIPATHAMGMPPHQANEMAMAMGMAAMQGGAGGEMGMGMFNPQQQYDSSLAALTAANLAAFNMHGMQAMGAMANQDFNNYGPMPPMGGGGGRGGGGSGNPPPPPPGQMY